MTFKKNLLVICILFISLLNSLSARADFFKYKFGESKLSAELQNEVIRLLEKDVGSNPPLQQLVRDLSQQGAITIVVTNQYDWPAACDHIGHTIILGELHFTEPSNKDKLEQQLIDGVIFELGNLANKELDAIQPQQYTPADNSEDAFKEAGQKFAKAKEEAESKTYTIIAPIWEFGVKQLGWKAPPDLQARGTTMASTQHFQIYLANYAIAMKYKFEEKAARAERLLTQIDDLRKSIQTYSATPSTPTSLASLDADTKFRMTICQKQKTIHDEYKKLLDEVQPSQLEWLKASPQYGEFASGIIKYADQISRSLLELSEEIKRFGASLDFKLSQFEAARNNTSQHNKGTKRHHR